MPPRLMTADGGGKSTPWYLYRVDLLRSCKTGDIVEATPRPLSQRLRIVAVGMLTGTPVILGAQWFFRTWVPGYYAELDALAKIDVSESARKLAEFTSLLLLAPVLICLVAVIAAVVYNSRVLRAGRWPLPGVPVRRRTEVVTGWCVRLSAIVLSMVLLACALTAWWSYVQLTSRFWNNYLDKRSETASKNLSRLTTAKMPGVAQTIGTGVTR